ncbi:hypothetical protein Bca52824_008022 [Brassica carinata]|uniref:RING-type E3 ubiquitin transferase n=1 Tax=Brassica carinata TaxID=52824 RepID=A0A8X7W912_BRACI|nr:hypothetical protein Bca52824_008022 [Brassica carinata]
MIIFLLFSACFLFTIHLLGFEEDKLIDWVRNWSVIRQKPSAQEETNSEETSETFTKEDDSTRDNHYSVALLDPDVLDCPICCEPLKIPIFQCNNGHLACSLCCGKLKNICPSCKIPIGYSRCRAMEKVVEASIISCPNAKYGCKKSTSYGNRSSHEKQCVFHPCSCPMRGCNYIGSYKHLYNHVRAKHRDELILFIWDISLSLEWDLTKTIDVLQEEEDGELIVVQVYSKPHGLIVRVSCIAPSEQGEFSCTLKFAVLGIELKQALVLRKIRKVRDNQPIYGFMLIPLYMLPSDGNLKMEICISRGQVHLNHA